MAVKNHNTYNIGTGSNANDMKMLNGMDPNASDAMVPGKYAHDSISDSYVGTNYTNNRQRGVTYAHLAESQDPDNKRGKKSRRLPKIHDDSVTSPKGIQYSSEFTKGRNKRGAYGGVHQGGYETENVVSPDHTRNDIFKFGSTNDSGFEMSHGNDMMHDNLASTGIQGKIKKKKNYTYMTLKNDHKSRSVSSNIGRLDHTCFI